MIIHNIAVMLIGCPCLRADETTTVKAQRKCASCCQSCGSGCGVPTLVVLTLFSTIFGIISWVQYPGLLFWWTIGLFQSWLLWFVKAALLDFNPSPTLIYLMTPLKKITCGVMEAGIWYKERRETLEVIREKMEQRGIMNMISVMDAADLGDEQGKYNSADTAAEKLKMAAGVAAASVAAVGVGVAAAVVDNTVE